MTQEQMVLKYLEDFGTITTYDAFIDLGITRLSAKIYNLKQMGYEFETKFETKENRYGKKVSFARYILKGE